MKPFGLRPGDGQKMRSGRGPNRRCAGGNKFVGTGTGDEGGPKGRHKEAKIGAEKRQVHAQGRADERKLIHDAKKEGDV